MPAFSTLDIFIGVAALVIAGIALYLFWRASGNSSTKTDEVGVTITVEDDFDATDILTTRRKRSINLPDITTHFVSSDIDKARSNIRTLTLKKELLGMVLKRLFEAEDNNEINRDERIRLSRGYETELKELNEELKQSELIMTLHELESIRDDILKKFEATLTSTQKRIDLVMKELKIEEIVKPKPKAPTLEKALDEEKILIEEESVPEIIEEERPRPVRPRSEVEEKLEQLRNEVLRELEELEKLELEA